MTLAENYTAEEWQTLQFAPLWAFTQVAGADKKIDEEEIGALVKELADAPVYRSALVREVFMAVAMNMGASLAAYSADQRKVGDGLKDVADLLDVKADHSEGIMFKGAIVGVAVKVAEASGPRFGKKVSKEEELAINFIGTVLRFSPTEFNQLAPTFHS